MTDAARRIRGRLDFAEFLQVGAPDVGAEGKIHEFSVAGRFDEAGGFEFLDVVRKCGGGDGDGFAQV